MFFGKDNKECLTRKEDLQERGGTYIVITTDACWCSLLATPPMFNEVATNSHVAELVCSRSFSESLMRDDRCALQHHNATDHF